ncbi:MAG: hypothetical protein Q9201_000243 [Fulgogasparrea decipioides]
MKLLTPLLFANLFFLSLSFSLQDRAVCNADNCLRALRRYNTSASPFCSTYIAPYTSTITATTTATIYSVISNSAGSIITPTPPPRDDNPISTQTYATPCSSTPRLSSACSCLLTSAPPAMTTTVPVATVTVTVCDPADNNGINYVRGATEDLINIDVQYPNKTDAHQCCANCFQTPGCLTYSMWGASKSIEGRCNLAVAVEGSITGPGVSETCPYGVYEAFNGMERREVGLGPCLDYRGSNE